MVRRRPRKEDHPDYLTDVQVAALWSHAAECYEHTNLTDEIEPCLRNALKYAAGDTALRLRLADFLLHAERGDAAEVQLQEITAADPQHVGALVRLGRLYETWWDRDPMPIWQQVLAVNPTHLEAREALADDYIKMTSDQAPFSASRFSVKHPGKSKIETLEIGLGELPNHPMLLIALGATHAHEHHAQQAREYLLQAYQLAPQDVKVVSGAMHELLHVNGGDAVLQMIPVVRQIPRLLPVFWFDQAKMALRCELGEQWADIFLQKAVKYGAEPGMDDTCAGLLVEAYELAHQENASGLCAVLEKRIREEVPTSGALSYIEAYRLYFEKGDVYGAARLMREAIKTARRVNDRGILRRAETIESLLKVMPYRFDWQRTMADLLPPDFM